MNRRRFIKSAVLFGMLAKVSFIRNSISVKQYFNKIIAINIDNESTEGGEIKCFIEGEKLIKVEEIQYWEGGRYHLDLFIENGYITIVKEKIEKYNVPFYITKESAEEIGSDEYFDENKSLITDSFFSLKNDSIIHYYSNINDHESLDKQMQRVDEFNLIVKVAMKNLQPDIIPS